jgi:hypothetical protein
MVRDYVASTAGPIKPHFLPGQVPDHNPVEFFRARRKRPASATCASVAGGIIAPSPTVTSLINAPGNVKREQCVCWNWLNQREQEI